MDQKGKWNLLHTKRSRWRTLWVGCHVGLGIWGSFALFGSERNFSDIKTADLYLNSTREHAMKLVDMGNAMTISNAETIASNKTIGSAPKRNIGGREGGKT